MVKIMKNNICKNFLINSTKNCIYTLLSTLIMLNYGCVKEELDEEPLLGNEVAKKTVVYSIQSGVHHSTPLALERVSSVYNFKIRVTFTKIQYLILNPDKSISNDQYDYNKLSGFSDCNNFDAYKGKGAMIGWRWNSVNNNIELVAYVHNKSDKSRKIKEFNLTAKEGEVWEFQISVDNYSNTYLYQALNLSNNESEMISMSDDYGRGCNGIPIEGRLISPWFGGNQVSPADLKLTIEYL